MVNPVLSQTRANIAAKMMLSLPNDSNTLFFERIVYSSRLSVTKNYLPSCLPAARVETWRWQTLCSFLCQLTGVQLWVYDYILSLFCGVIGKCMLLHPWLWNHEPGPHWAGCSRLPVQTNLMSLWKPGLQGEIKRKKKQRKWGISKQLLSISFSNQITFNAGKL